MWSDCSDWLAGELVSCDEHGRLNQSCALKLVCSVDAGGDGMCCPLVVGRCVVRLERVVCSGSGVPAWNGGERRSSDVVDDVDNGLGRL